MIIILHRAGAVHSCNYTVMTCHSRVICCFIMFTLIYISEQPFSVNPCIPSKINFNVRGQKSLYCKLIVIYMNDRQRSYIFRIAESNLWNKYPVTKLTVCATHAPAIYSMSVQKITHWCMLKHSYSSMGITCIIDSAQASLIHKYSTCSQRHHGLQWRFWRFWPSTIVVLVILFCQMCMFGVELK